jgi:SAM-dependent methyltransferase
VERAAYHLMAAHEDRHWWFVGRRAVISALLDRIELPPHPQIVEAGCGTGGNLDLLERRGSVRAFEPHGEAADIAQDRHPTIEVQAGELPGHLPYPSASFDLVAALDVLEHVDDDARALASLVRLARPGGWIIVTVPAHQALWGSHDRRLHHLRRYGRRQLHELAAGAGVDIVFETAFNTVLAPIAVVYRAIERVVGGNFGNQERLPPTPVNRLLSRLFAIERRIVTRRAIPFGLSYALVLRRPDADTVKATPGEAR